uniref:DCAF15_WD40 domain-containing protein n=1 Tax=Mesocestoides corti TaxID=53468 RepID=A0A5K3F5X6_MESCO
MNLQFLIHRRETFGSLMPATSGLKCIRLRNILPQNLLDEVFLGFSADSNFLVSYNSRSRYVKLRFWLIPGEHYGPRNWLQTSFADIALDELPTHPFLSDMFGIRFIQSLNDPQTFVVIFSSASSDHVSMIWGTLPDPNCLDCRGAFLSRETSASFKCTKHLQLLRLYPDYQAFCTKSGNSFDEVHSPENNGQTPIPACFSHYCLCNSHRATASSSYTCVCMANSTSGLHPSVCPETGRLRVAWVSQGRQIRVLSCSFGPKSACSMPMGAYLDLRNNGTCVSTQPPLAYQEPFLTSNYCSSCFFWPTDTSSCRQRLQTSQFCARDTTSTMLKLSGLKELCVFKSSPVRIVKVSDPWPDGHKHPILPSGKFLQEHKCETRVDSLDVWKPSLLAARELFNSCKPLCYLAMLQDIRASYMHWTLLPRCGYENGRNPSCVAPDSNPEKLLTNQLCGQCHSYFDAVDWQPYLQGTSVIPHSPVVAHMEEVVFDLPEVVENSNHVTECVLFTSPLEPNWILVYEIDYPSGAPSCHLTALIDIATGRQRDPDEAQHAVRLEAITSHCPSLLRYSGTVSNHHFCLPMLAASPPLPRVPFQHPLTTRSTTLIELNNYSVTTARQSVTRLCDPQGGYVLYL